MDRVLNADEVCEALKISRPTLRRLVKQGYLRTLGGLTKFLFAESELRKYLQGNAAETH